MYESCWKQFKVKKIYILLHKHLVWNTKSSFFKNKCPLNWFKIAQQKLGCGMHAHMVFQTFIFEINSKNVAQILHLDMWGTLLMRSSSLTHDTETALHLRVYLLGLCYFSAGLLMSVGWHKASDYELYFIHSSDFIWNRRIPFISLTSITKLLV